MTTKAYTPPKKPCIHCDPNTPVSRSIVEPILTMHRSEALRVAGSRAESTPMSLHFQCRMCSRTWAHRVDIRFRDAYRVKGKYDVR